MHRSLVLPIALAWLSLSAARCHPVAATTDAIGQWGGEHIALTVTDTGSTLEYDCAHGSITGPIRPDGDGRFAATGTHVREHGGPVRIDETPDAHPASYTGRVTDDRMALTVRETDTGTVIGTYALQRGVAGRVLRCL